MNRRTFMKAAASSAVAMHLPKSQHPDDGYPDRINARDHYDVIVRLDGRPVWLGVEADRTEGWIRVMVPDKPLTNFHRKASVSGERLRDVRYKKLYGTVTFERDTPRGTRLKKAERDSL